MKILVLSSQALNTGSTLRGWYIHKYLKKLDKQADFIAPPFNSMPFMADFVLSFFYYFFRLMNTRYDVVIIVKPYPNTVIPAFMLKSRGAKIVIDVDDLDYGYRNGFLSGIIKWMQRKLIKSADNITTHNKALYNILLKENPEYKDKIYTLKQCVDMELFNRNAVNKGRLAAIKKNYKGKKILFFMAHMNVAGYLEDILQSLCYLKEDFVLLTAGGGPYLRHCAAAAKKLKLDNRVVFMGQMRNDSIKEYIAAADVCLVYYKDIPVNQYRCSMKLREYLAMNKKVAATGVGEMRDFKKYVFLSSPKHSSYAASISKAIKSLDKTHEKGYKFIRCNYNWEYAAADFYKYLSGGIK